MHGSSWMITYGYSIHFYTQGDLLSKQTWFKLVRNIYITQPWAIEDHSWLDHMHP
jgi:hypothetical protein